MDFCAADASVGRTHAESWQIIYDPIEAIFPLVFPSRVSFLSRYPPLTPPPAFRMGHPLPGAPPLHPFAGICLHTPSPGACALIGFLRDFLFNYVCGFPAPGVLHEGRGRVGHMQGAAE